MRGTETKVPHDLKSALDERPSAARRFAAMSEANQAAWCGFIEEVDDDDEHRWRRIKLLIEALET